MKHTSAQSGSALFVILIAIALFAALSYAFMRGSSGNTSQVTDQQARMAAQEIISYGNTMADAVQKLKLRGCEDNQINFVGYLDYANPTSPPDGMCNVFSASGGKVTPPNLTRTALDQSQQGLSNFGDIVFTGNLGVINIGTSNTELVLYIPYMSKAVCEYINQYNSVKSDFTSDNASGGAVKFSGSYTPASSPYWGDEDTALAGKTAFCSYNHLLTSYFFTQVLLAR